MKNVITRNRTAFIALMTALSFGFVSPVMATTKADPPTVEVKYLGFKESNPVFQITVSSIEADNYLIKIRDKEGNLLFSERLNGNVSRSYRIDTEEEIKEGGLVFEVTSSSTKKTEKYTVGVTEKTIKDVAVNKIQ